MEKEWKERIEGQLAHANVSHDFVTSSDNVIHECARVKRVVHPLLTSSMRYFASFR